MRLSLGIAVSLGLGAGLLQPVLAQSTAQLAARCQQLIAYYDRFGVGRSTNSDGRRNHTRIRGDRLPQRPLCQGHRRHGDPAAGEEVHAAAART